MSGTQKSLYDIADEACQMYGAWRVRRTALRQIKDGSKDALLEVGIDTSHLDFTDILIISDRAFSQLNDKEKLRDFCSDSGCEMPEIEVTQRGFYAEFEFHGSNRKKD